MSPPWAHPDAGVTFPWQWERVQGGPRARGILGSFVNGVRCAHLTVKSGQASEEPNQQRGMVAASWIGGLAGLVRGALTRLRHKGGAGALGETDRDIQDAPSQPVQWRKRRLVR